MRRKYVPIGRRRPKYDRIYVILNNLYPDAGSEAAPREVAQRCQRGAAYVDSTQDVIDARRDKLRITHDDLLRALIPEAYNTPGKCDVVLA